MLRPLVCIGFTYSLLLSANAYPADNCRVIEYHDHIEVVCIGTPAQTSAAPSAGTTVVNNEKGAEVSRKRRHLQTIRNQNAHRLDDVIDKPADNALPVARQETSQTKRKSP